MNNTHCHCPYCGFKVDFPENLANTSAFCPSCGKQIQLQVAIVEAPVAPATPMPATPTPATPTPATPEPTTPEPTTPEPTTPTPAASAPVTSAPAASVAEPSSKPDSKQGKGKKAKASRKSKNRGGLQACPDCNEPISAKYLMCPHCGHVSGKLNELLGNVEGMLAQTGDNTGTIRWVVSVFAIIMIIVALRACIH
jgi:DNA-directed RNA polymerase subunit RPC12/RpoP